MRKTSLLIIILLSFNANAIEGVMNCTLKKQAVYSIDEGRVTEFSGYKDSIEAGESYKLKYGLDDSKLYFEMIGAENLLFSTAFLDTAKISSHYESIRVMDRGGLGKNFSIGKNSISLSSGTYGMHRFKRYYKDDWMGITISQVVRDSSIDNHTALWDCKHITNSKFDEIYNRLNKLK